jgi:mRNA interferase MazF
MMIDAEVRRGCIYLVDLGPDTGSGKKRPALVVQNDLGNRAGATTIVVALSSSVPPRRYPFHVGLPAEILGRPGIIMCEHLRTVSLERVDRQALGECPPAVMEQVEEALRLSLGLSARV